MMLEEPSKHPLPGPSGHLSPCPGERKGALPWPVTIVSALTVWARQTTPRFLSPGQGERWLAKRDGEGVLPFRERGIFP